jgi:hypothetical protein
LSPHQLCVAAYCFAWRQVRSRTGKVGQERRRRDRTLCCVPEPRRAEAAAVWATPEALRAEQGWLAA